MNQQFRSIVYLSDRSGTAKWRKIWPIQSIDCIAQSINLQLDYSQTPIIDQNYYKGVNTVTVQRWISEQQRDLFCKFLKPLMDNQSQWLIYEEDDFMFDGTLLNESKRKFLENKYGDLRDASITRFNRGRKAFEGKATQQSIKDMLDAADFITVTTDYIKEAYCDFYDIPIEKIISVPNLLPRYLFNDRYDKERKLKQFSANKLKPRIGIVSSLSHFNIDNVRVDKNGNVTREAKQPDGSSKWINELNEEVQESETTKITDDFDEIADTIRSLVNDFQFVCFGYCPPQIQDLLATKKIEYHPGLPIMNYPSMLENLQLQAIIAPIKKTVFNYCKSFIKTMEAAAIGVPLFATNCLPYNRVMPKDQLFDSAQDLKDKLMKLKFTSSHIYGDIIEKQWNWLNSPCHEGDFDLKNFWLEDNLNIHVDMCRLRQKTLLVSMNSFSQQYEAKKKAEQENTILKNDNIQILK